MFCFHNFGMVQDGYQYCVKCNKAIVAPCPHKWKHTGTVYDDLVREDKILSSFIHECEKCGEVKEYNIKVERIKRLGS